MPAAPVTALYAGLLALLFVGLSARVIARRRASGIALGVGGDRDLERASRVHANFAEYVPFALLLMLMVEVAGYRPWLLHVAGATLLVGRVVHAVGVSRATEDVRLRVVGVACSLTVVVVLALLLLATPIV